MSGCGSTSSMTGLAAPASAVRRTQSQGAGRAASATEAAGLGPELLPRPEPALHHRLISPLTYFRLGSYFVLKNLGGGGDPHGREVAPAGRRLAGACWPVW